MVTKVRQIAAGKFKAECLSLLDEVAATGEEIVVTKRGKPVAKLVRASPELPPSLRGSVVCERRLLDPTGERWDADA